MTSLFSNDEYENIPLVPESQLNSRGTRTSARLDNGPSHFIQSNKKFLLGLLVFIAVVALISFASSGRSHHSKSAKAADVSTAPIESVPTVLHPEVQVPFAANDSAAYKSKETQEDYLEQFKTRDEEASTHNPPPEYVEEEDKGKEKEEESSTESHDEYKDADPVVVQGGAFVDGRAKNKKRGGGKRQSVKNGEPDISILQKALKSSSQNPFSIDYPTIIKDMVKQNPTPSGELDASYDYSTRKFRSHSGHYSEADLELFHSLRFFHFSDTHVDPFFNPFQSAQQGVCASCRFNSKIYGENTHCPLHTPFKPDVVDISSGYAFGRYRCNPNPQLMASMLAYIRSHQREPSFLLITGDIGAHGRPDDQFHLSPDTKLTDLCPTKFDGMRETLKLLREVFPNTPILFTPGNNDHLPKNTVWTPYFEAFAALLVEFKMLHPSQAQVFSRIGSHYVDLEVDNQRYIDFITTQAQNNTNTDISEKMTAGLDKFPEQTKLRVLLPDMTLLAPGGEASFVDPSSYEHLEGLERENVEFPKRAELLRWLNQTLFEAQRDERTVLLAGHQPLSTKKGQNELLLTSTSHGLLFKALIAQYASIISGAFFGHRNLASIQNILSPSGEFTVPSLVIPGVSPRGLNFPAFHEVAISRSSGKILDFEQFVFDLMEENERAQILSSSLKDLISPENLAENRDGAAEIVHSIMGARQNDVYDPEALADDERKHQVERAEQINKGKADKLKAMSDKQLEEYTKAKTIADQFIMKHGFACGDDEELCKFMEKWGYLGHWNNHPETLKSWRTMTGYTEFTAQTVADMNSRVTTSGKLFTALQVFKRAGYVGDQTSENVYCQGLYDDEDMMMLCLFPEQDTTEGCFQKSWIK